MKSKDLFIILFLILIVFLALLAGRLMNPSVSPATDLNEDVEIQSLYQQISDAKKVDDYYSVVRYSNQLIEKGVKDQKIFDEQQSAERKILEQKLFLISSKSDESYEAAIKLEGVNPAYSNKIAVIKEKYEAARDYAFSKDYEEALEEYTGMIQLCSELQEWEENRIPVIRNRRSSFRLKANVESMYPDFLDESENYRLGIKYLKNGEEHYIAGVFDQAQSDYMSSIAMFQQASKQLSDVAAFSNVKQHYMTKVESAQKLVNANNYQDFDKLMNNCSAQDWQQLKLNVSKADEAAETNDFSAAINIYTKAIVQFSHILNKTLVEQRKDQELLKKTAQMKENVERKEYVSEMLSKKSYKDLNKKVNIIFQHPFELTVGPDVVIDMQPINAGSYSLRSNRSDRDSDAMLEVVLTSGFWISKSETTLAMYKEYLNQTSNFRGVDISQFGPFVKNKAGMLELSRNKYARSEKQPVFAVDWDAAIGFCEWLNSLSDTIRPDGYIFRLPTEAEWTYCAMHEEEFKSDEENLMKIAWYSKNSNSTSHEVCELMANSLGLYDMYGNVWEWCADAYVPSFFENSSGVVTNRLCTKISEKRVVKGGSWDFSGSVLAPEKVKGFYRNAKQNAIGFRVVLAPAL